MNRLLGFAFLQVNFLTFIVLFHVVDGVLFVKKKSKWYFIYYLYMCSIPIYLISIFLCLQWNTESIKNKWTTKG